MEKYNFCAECEKIVCDNCMDYLDLKEKNCKCSKSCCKNNDKKKACSNSCEVCFENEKSCNCNCLCKKSEKEN